MVLLLFQSWVIVSILVHVNPSNGQLGRLASLNVNREWITLSGFSSGGTFAQQLQFSYSSLFSGIGVFSHAYYRCGPGDANVTNYDNFCTTIGRFPIERLWNPNRVLQDIDSYYRHGLIEDPRNLLNKKLYVYSGTQNVFFTLDQMLRILNIYEPFIRSPDSIKTRVQNANYTLPTNSFGGSCTGDSSEDSYISNCGFSGAFDALNWLLGHSVVNRIPDPNVNIHLQPLQTFDQTEFFYGYDGPGNMDDVGFMYIPKGCRSSQKQCFLHVYFHGCFVGREFFGENHVRNSGYLEVAELNNIIMLFPQTHSSLPQNMIGCWDTYGLSGRYYATQRGAQIRILRNMLARLLGEKEYARQEYNDSFSSTFQGQTPARSYYSVQQALPPNYEDMTMIYDSDGPNNYVYTRSAGTGYGGYSY